MVSKFSFLFYDSENWGNDPIWLLFANGLKKPTRNWVLEMFLASLKLRAKTLRMDDWKTTSFLLGKRPIFGELLILGRTNSSLFWDDFFKSLPKSMALQDRRVILEYPKEVCLVEKDLVWSEPKLVQLLPPSKKRKHPVRICVVQFGIDFGLRDLLFCDPN